MNTRIPIVVAAVLVSAHADAASVPNTFSSGEPAVASEVNANFDALIGEIEAIQTSVDDSMSTTFENYFVSPSSDGSLGSRNVIVWRQDPGTAPPAVGTDEGGCYIARGWFNNTIGATVESASGTVNPDELWVWQMVCGNESGVSYELEYVYAVPASGGFLNAQAIEVNLDQDGDGTFDAEAAFDYQYEWSSTPLSNAELVHTNDLYFNESGEIVSATNFTQTRRQIDRSITVNGMTFDNVMVTSFLGFDRVRFHAEGIGAILELNGAANSDPVFNENQQRRGVIFYRMNGEEQGDLSGTPFATGVTINQWFQ